jgi:NAD kinase
MPKHKCIEDKFPPSPCLSPSTIRAWSPVYDFNIKDNSNINLLLICKKDETVLDLTMKLVEKLLKYRFEISPPVNFTIFVEKWIFDRTPNPTFPLSPFHDPFLTPVDLIVSLGGDGTVLYSAWIFQGMHVPLIIPIYLKGTLGFLTLFDYEEALYCMEEALLILMKSPRNLHTNLRMRLRCCVHKQNRDGSFDIEAFHVLNELVIDRGPNPFMVNLDIFGNQAFMTNVLADGIVVATPTGSTAYSVCILLIFFVLTHCI